MNTAVRNAFWPLGWLEFENKTRAVRLRGTMETAGEPGSPAAKFN